MKLLFDANISWRVIKLIQPPFPECIHVGNLKGKISKDIDIWKYAKENDYTIVTFDEDFFT